MALGKKLFQWSYPDIIKGMSSSDGISDGGFSSNTDAINITAIQGIAYQSNFPTDKSTGLTGEMIASCEDPTGNYKRLYVSTVPSNGRFWSLDGVNAVTQRGATDSTHQYVQGKTDMIAFDNEAYITSNSTIVRWSAIGSVDTIDNAFFTFSDAFSPHPALVFETYAYYGDGNLLYRQSAAGVTPTVILTLPSSWVIVALGIDPGSGRMLISVIGQINLSGGVNSGARVMFYDGFSGQSVRSVLVDDMVTAFAPTEGALYCSYGQSFGVWNGSGITFLRKMNVDFDNTQLMYKHHFTSIGSTLYFIEKHKVIAYGPVRQKGDNVFYPALANISASTGLPVNLTNIANIGGNVISISYPTSKFAIWETLTSSGSKNSLALYTNSVDFDDEFWIRRIRVIFNDLVGINVTPGQLYIYNEGGFVNQGGNGGGAYSLINSSGATIAYKDILNVDLKLKQIQLRVILDTGNYGIRRIIVYGDPANITGSPTGS